MALSSTHLDTLDLAIATGQLRVTMDGKTIEYRTISELMKARAHVARVIQAASTGTTRTAPRHQLADFSDG